MPGWGEVLAELNATRDPQTGRPDFDLVRRGHLARLNQMTGRSSILDYTDWLSGASQEASISLEDMTGMMEVIEGLPGFSAARTGAFVSDTR